LDEGRIYVYNTTTRALTVLRKHRGTVTSLAFAPPAPGKGPVLVSTALEYDAKGNQTGAIRVWDVAKGAEIVAGTDQPTRNIFPGLAVWRTGNQLEQIRIGYSWGDAKFRVWDVADGKLYGKQADGDNDAKLSPEKQLNQNNTAVWWADQEKFLTASYWADTGGRVRLWNFRRGEGPLPEREPLASFPKEANGRYVPRALTLLAADGKVKPDHAVVVVRRDPKEGHEEYQLRLIGLTGANVGKEKANVVLWHGGESMPSLAAAPSGEFIATAGNKDQTILVFRTADLLAGKVKPMQELKGVGVAYPQVGFVRRGKEAMGLVLRTTAAADRSETVLAPKAGDLVFDFTTRKLVSYSDGWKYPALTPDAWGALLADAARKELAWKSDAPARDGWEVTAEIGTVDAPAEKPRFVIRKDNQKGTVQLAEGQRVTKYAFVPPRAPLQIPILAVAFTERGLPRLRLYNGLTGEQVRQCSGHTDPIRSLAVSSGGRLLVSAAEDQTICVWSLTNLDKIVAQHGQLAGFAVRDTVDKTVEVVRVAADGPASGKIKVGDVIEKLGVGNAEPKAVSSARQFYDALFLAKPGDTVTLQIKGKAAAVKLPVGQGIDERKPLFTLFVSPGAKPQDWEWVGWNPQGFYESSGAEAETYIGWHTNNTDTPEKAATFAAAPEHRKRFYRESILQFLVRRGNLADALKDWENGPGSAAVVRPTIILSVREALFDPAARGKAFVRGGPVHLDARVDNLNADDVEWVRYRVDGEAGGLKDLDWDGGQNWAVDLTRLTAKPGQHTVRVRVKTKGGDAREWEESLSVRYQPPAPTVGFDPQLLKDLNNTAGPGELPRLTTDKETITVRAKMEPGAKGQKVRVTVRLGDNDPIPIENLEEREKLKLKPGDQWIELRAVNVGALPGFEEDETARALLSVLYLPKGMEEPKAAPKITLEKIGSARPDASLTPYDSTALVIWPQAKVRLVGTISAEEKPEAKCDGKVMNLKAGEGKSFLFDHIVEFRQLGKHDVIVEARTKGSKTDLLVVPFDYQPGLPQVELTQPADGLTLYDEGKGAGELEILARLIPSDDPRDCEAELLVNDAPVGKPRPVAAGATEFRATLTPKPGLNRVQVRLRVGQAIGQPSDAVVVRFLRPPRDLSFEDAAKWAKPTDKANANLAVSAYSALELSPNGVRATVNRRALTAVVEKGKDEATWRILFKGVPLEDGENEIQVWAANADGESRRPAVLTITYQPPPKAPPKPVVEILDRGGAAAVTVADFEIRARITSESKISALRLVREEKDAPAPTAIDLAGLKEVKEGTYEARIMVKLSAGGNRLRLEADNDGGTGFDSTVITYVPPPVRLQIEYLSPKNKADKFEPTGTRNGGVMFDAPQDRCVVHGWVLWEESQDDVLRGARPFRVRGFVNGKHQAPAKVFAAKPGERRREFELDVQFTQAKDNLIEIETPDLPQEASSPTVLLASCAAPKDQQYAHLLIIGTGKTSEEVLTAKALHAVQGDIDSKKGPRFFKAPAFAQGGRVYRPLTGGNVSPDSIYSLLQAVRAEIEGRSGEGSANDVVVVYYEGNEEVCADGHFFRTNRSRYDSDLKTSAMPMEGLEKACADMLGAHVLLLDVARDGSPRAAAEEDDRDRVVKRPGRSHLSVFRSMCWMDHAGAPIDPELLAKWSDVAKDKLRLREIGEEVKTRIKPLTYDMAIPKSAEGLPVGATADRR
jgi:WD40 repeat protein